MLTLLGKIGNLGKLGKYVSSALVSEKLNCKKKLRENIVLLEVPDSKEHFK